MNPIGPIDAEPLQIRLLAWVVDAGGDEVYRVSFRRAAGEAFVPGDLTHVQGDRWALHTHGDVRPLEWMSPDAVFALALGHDPTADRPTLNAAAPHWPAAMVERLAARRLAGPGTVAFDRDWFLAELATSAFDHPLVLPDAAAKLGLTGLERATAVLSAKDARATGLADRLLRAVSTAWDGEGRLIAEFPGDELAQLGVAIDDGCRAALGTGPLEVVFAPGEALGLGLGPLVGSDGDERWGCAVGEVDAGGAADRAGVMPGMSLSHLSHPFLDLSPGSMSFEAVLEAIDTRRTLGDPLTITFHTAACVTHLYAVEMPAAAALDALSATVGGAPFPGRDVGVGASLDALCGDALRWREGTPRLFLGEPGSVTSAHSDMCPQVQMAHTLLGTKLLGIAAHDATPRLGAEHADDRQGATHVPTDRPLTARASRLLGDPAMTFAVLLPGDLAVFDSGALHVASNGADGLCGAIYHGMITPGALPRLRLAAAAPSIPRHGAYRDHLFAPDLLRLVEPPAS